MTWVEKLTNEVGDQLSVEWNTRNGNVIPETSGISLTDGAVKITATFLYADLVGSSKLAKLCPWTTTAKIIRAYLKVCTKLIRAYDGEIRSFDGDRVMGVFMGDYKNTHATRCAREIDWVVEKVIAVKAMDKFKSIRDNDIKIKHCIGIDMGEVVAVRAGIRNNNDLIWVGRAASMAAKLSDLRTYPYSVYISSATYAKLGDSDKILNDGSNMWEQYSFKFAGEEKIVYRTKQMKTP